MKPEQIDSEIAELARDIRGWTEHLVDLDRELQPFRLKENALKVSIRNSYRHRIGDAVLKYDGANRELRFGLYAEWERLIEIYGPTREKRRDMQADIDAAMRTIDRLRKMLELDTVQRTKKTKNQTEFDL